MTASIAVPVETGDTVRSFVDRYQTTVAVLRELNGELDVDLDGLILSNKLLVPAGSSSNEPKTTTTSTGEEVQTVPETATIGKADIPIQTIPVGAGKVLSVAAGNAYLLMVEAAKVDGIDLPLKSAYRSNEEQKRLYALYLAGTGNKAAKPGTSQHEQGLSIDVLQCPEDSDRYKWLTINAARFGFVANALGPPQKETWHWTYLA